MSPLLNLLALQNYLGLNQDCSRLDGVIHRQLHIGLIGPSCYWVVRSVRQVHFTAHNRQRTVDIESRRPSKSSMMKRPPKTERKFGNRSLIDRAYSSSPRGVIKRTLRVYRFSRQHIGDGFCPFEFPG